MNIEGAEYEIIRNMLLDSTFCLFDEVYMYFHQGQGNMPRDLPRNSARVIKWLADSDICNITWERFWRH